MEEAWFEILRRYRDESGVSLQELSLRTRIGMRHIQALEIGDLTLLSSPAFVRGFIRSICAELRKDPAPIVIALNRSLAPPPSDKELEAEAENGQRRLLTPLLISGVVLAILVAGAFLLHGRRVADEQQFSTMARDVPSAAITAAPYEEDQVAVALTQQAAEAATTPPEEPAPLPDLDLTINAVERTWLRYTADDGIPQEATLSAGESIRVKAASTISLFIGNAGGIFFNLNGKAFGPPGEQGQVLSNYVISRDNL